MSSSTDQIREEARRRLETEQAELREATLAAEEKERRRQEEIKSIVLEGQIKARVEEERIRLEVERELLAVEAKRKLEEREAVIQVEMERLRSRSKIEILQDQITEMHSVQSLMFETIKSLRAEIESLKGCKLVLDRPVIPETIPTPRNIRESFIIRRSDTNEVKQFKKCMLSRIESLNTWKELWYEKKHGGYFQSTGYHELGPTWWNERPKFTNPDTPKPEKRNINLDLEYMTYDEFTFLLLEYVNVINENMCNLKSGSHMDKCMYNIILPFTKSVSRSFKYNVFKKQSLRYFPQGREMYFEVPHTDCEIDVIKLCPLDWKPCQIDSFNQITKEFCRRFEHPVPKDEIVHYSVFVKMFDVINSISNDFESINWSEETLNAEARKLRYVLTHGGFVSKPA